MGYAIETKKLTKFYGKSRGIVDVDLAVEEGEIFGFIGPNGAGKSTTIRTLLGLIKKSGGSAAIFGMDCEKDKVQILSEVGYLPGEVFYYDNMRAIDLLRYSASFYKKDCTKRITELADALSLDLNKKIEDMSLGNKKKVGIVQGLLHSPRLIILDEPTSGLDPLMQRTFFDLIQRENERGATVLFSSHILGEVQRICDRVAIIKEGRIVDLRSIDDLRVAIPELHVHEPGCPAGRADREAEGTPVCSCLRITIRDDSELASTSERVAKPADQGKVEVLPAILLINADVVDKK